MKSEKQVHNIVIKWFIALLFISILSLSVFPIKVLADAPVISVAPPSGYVNTSYSFTFSATCDGGVCPTSTWAITGSMPPGLSASGRNITGTPTTVGIYDIHVTVSNSYGTTDGDYSIVISNPPLTFSTTTLPTALVGQAYSSSITATGGGGTTISYAMTSGTLPSGLIFNAGVLSGTPARGTAGTYSFTITATSGTTTASQTFSIYVDKGTYDVTVTISSGLGEGQTKLYVGNVAKGTLRGGESIKLTGLDPDNIATISVDSIVASPGRTDVRYKAESTTASASQDITQITFNYFTEYEVSLKSDPSGITSLSGSGWYKSGMPLAVTAPDSIEQDNDSQYRFSYWLSPGGDKIRSETLNVGITAAGTYVATYDLYYKLDIVSKYGSVKGGGWQKAGSVVQWSVDPTEMAMPGIMGFFGGKYKAALTSGTATVEGPKTMTIQWEGDYTTPAITIPLTLIVIAGIIYGIYSLAKRERAPQPAAFPMAYQGMAPMPPPPPMSPYQAYPPPLPPTQIPPAAIPPPQTTVVMIGEGLRKSPQSTREQLMEKFGELLQKYEDEISQGKELNAPPSEMTEITPPSDNKRLTAPEMFATAETVIEKQEPVEECGFTTKKLLRTVVTQWKNTSIRPITVTPGDKKSAALAGGRTVTWTRESYNEWELHVCKLPMGHKGTHKGATEIVYSLLDSISEDRNYGPKQPLKQPSPHYTDGMPEIDIAASQIIQSDQLPS
ncbi:MAG: PKD domain-containing protein [Dehalococcoidia bacterium]|nr:PKD domain-containing protein [Dehalococcoidia bacterium]